MSENRDDYPCIGVCENDPEGKYCVGCGRPLDPSISPKPGNINPVDSVPPSPPQTGTGKP